MCAEKTDRKNCQWIAGCTCVRIWLHCCSARAYWKDVLRSKHRLSIKENGSLANALMQPARCVTGSCWLCVTRRDLQIWFLR